MDGPCEWPIVWPDSSAATDEQRAAWGPVAAYVLWALTGRRLGRCRQWLRPLVAPPASCGYQPRIVEGRWLNAPGSPTGFRLPHPIVEVHAVNIGGAVLDASAWRRAGDLLIRVDGQDWPRLQDPAAAPFTTGWWGVDVTTGHEVPVAGRIAAGVLAAELVKANTGGKCKLPARAQSVAREGVDVALLDPAALYENGLTGVPEADRWIAAANPARLAEGPRVVSVETLRRSPDHPLRRP